MPEGVTVPPVLRPFMLGIDFIPFRKVRVPGAYAASLAASAPVSA